MPAADRSVPFTTTAPARLLALAREHAERQGLTLAALLRELLRERLTAAGVTLPAPLPPKRTGPKPRGRRKSKAGA